MSWSFSRKGKPSEVAAAAQSYFDGVKGNFAEPERAVVDHVCATICLACGGMPDEKATVDVSSYGSQSTYISYARL
jgi:hypothetical protein